MAKDLDVRYVITGLFSTVLSVILLVYAQLLMSGIEITFLEFMTTAVLLLFIFFLGALMLSFTSITETRKYAFISTLIITLISIAIYNFIAGGATAVFSTTNPVASLINWGVDVAIVVFSTAFVYFLGSKLNISVNTSYRPFPFF